MGSWRVVFEKGRASEVHADPMAYVDVRTARFVEVTHSALVLGSSQKGEQVRQSELNRLGAELVRRRSGGGAVFLSPSGQLWVDLAIPRSDPLYRDDISESFSAISEVYAHLLKELGAEELEVHAGRLTGGQAARSICFAGVGPGEITMEGAKVIGMSQRRTSKGAVIQSTVYLRYPFSELRSLIIGSEVDALRPGYALGVAEIFDEMAELEPDAALSRLQQQLVESLETLL